MLISHVSTEEGGESKGGTECDANAQEYETANELFELMARNHNFQTNDDDSLTTRDLVLIYKNIDIGTKLMSNANDFKRKSSNQYVENVVHEEHDSDSDLSDVYSAEDLHNVVMINKERIDLFNHPAPLENTLCHKFGEFQMQSTNCNVDYDQQFLFKDPYIQEQLKNLNINTNDQNYSSTLLPATLLDILCCKRLEDNYIFYMENIIKYVKHTIDQLKRISNGDYLTEKAKEMWKEVEQEIRSEKYINDKKSTKVLANSTSIPLHVERKENGHVSFWDEIIHSEVDIRSLSKILEKKIVVEIPKSICGPYNFFSKCFNDNLIIRCKKDNKILKSDEKGEERLDVIVKLNRSDSGHVMSNIRSIMFLQTKPATDDRVTEVKTLAKNGPENLKNSLALEEVAAETDKTLYRVEEEESKENTLENYEPGSPKTTEKTNDVDKGEYECVDEVPTKLEPDENIQNVEETQNNSEEAEFDHRSHGDAANSEAQIHSESVKSETQSHGEAAKMETHGKEIKSALKDINVDFYTEDDSSNNGWYINEENNGDGIFESRKYLETSSSQSLQRNNYDLSYPSCDSCESPVKRPNVETSYKFLPPDELRMTIQRLNMQDSLPEDPAEGSVSPIKRKSPTRYRIKSPYENKSYIIEEKKRKKLLEIRQIREKKKIALTESCKKFGKGVIMPQSSSSVTKLSISNKSFYNSIYGDTALLHTKPKSYIRGRKGKKNVVDDAVTDSGGAENNISETTSLQNNANDHFYLENTMTEMMYIKMKKKENDDKQGVLYSETTTSMASNDLGANMKIISQLMTSQLDDHPDDQADDQMEPMLLTPFPTKAIEDTSAKNTKTARSLNTEREDLLKRNLVDSDTKKKSTKVDFRQSIDKIYNLIKSTKLDNGEENYEYDKADLEILNSVTECKSNSQCSDSGTSLKHQLTSSNHSYFSFSKSIEAGVKETKNSNTKAAKPASSAIPKVIINSKPQTPKLEKEKFNKKDRIDSKKHSPPRQPPENPLKAISQLLHEFDNVQKQRIKTAEKNQKLEVKETKQSPRPILRKPRVPADSKDNEPHSERPSRNMMPKDRKLKQIHTMVDHVKPPQPAYQEDRHGPKVIKKQLPDIIDEYKEAKGEAVRGPPKLTSARLNMLAQPKKHYVQAQCEQYQAKYGRNRLSERLHRLNAPPSSPNASRNTNKLKQKNDGHKLNLTPPTEKTEGLKSSISHEPVVVPIIQQPQVIDLPGKLCTNKIPVLKKKIGSLELTKNISGHSRPTAPGDLFKEQLLNKGMASTSITDDSPIEESTKIARKIHIMIDSMTHSTLKPTLTVLTECNESNSKLSTNDPDDTPDLDEKSSEKDMNQLYQNATTNSETTTNDTSVVRSLTEITNLQHRVPAGSFQKRVISLRNLKLTPGQSTQRVMLLQSGDASSIVVKSTVSQELKIKNSKSDTFPGLKALSELQQSTFDWTFTQIPMQITTVGYSFPQYNADTKMFTHVAKSCATRGSIRTVSECSECSCFPLNKSCQCFKGHTNDSTDEVSDGKSLVAKLSAPIKGLRGNFEKQTPRLGTTRFRNLNKMDEDQNKDRLSSTEATDHCTSIPTLVFKNSRANKPNTDIALKKASNIMHVVSDIIPETSLENIRNDSIKTVEAMDRVNPSRDATKSYESPEMHVNSLSCVDEKSENNVDYSTSLDILVGLLNEIKNITTCQTRITNPRDAHDGCEKALDSILNNAASLEQPRITAHPIQASDIVSISSLDKLRQLESNPSIYSYLLSNDGEGEYTESELNVEFDYYAKRNIMSVWPKPVYLDKEISVEFPERHLVSKCTDVPSAFFPVLINHATSTIFSSAAVGVMNTPSNGSLPPADPIPDINTLQTEKTTLELNRTDITDNIQATVQPTKKESKIKKLEPKSSIVKLCTEDMKTEPIVELCKETPAPTQQDHSKLVLQDYYECTADPIMKMKRDVLVTMYSLLVFTVFAALSYPQIMYR